MTTVSTISNVAKQSRTTRGHLFMSQTITVDRYGRFMFVINDRVCI